MGETLDEKTLAQLCQRYSLGSPLAPLASVLGGLRHRMYHLQTPQGEFALKVLSPDACADSGERAQLRRGEQIAAAVAAAGLPAVAALSVHGKVLQEVGSEVVLLYPWVAGKTLSTTPADSHCASQIGQILGQIHRLSLPFPERHPLEVANYPASEWASLADQAEAAGQTWGAELRSALPELSRWGRALVEAQQALAAHRVISHSDLHQQNVLWTDAQTPWLIDWESAGPQQAQKEAVVCALEWSGFVEGEPDLTAFRAFLNAYRSEVPLSTEAVATGLRCCFGNWLGWLLFSARRALDGTDPEERAGSARQVTGTLATIRRVERSFSRLEEAGGCP